jgi:hypothetical protein
MTVAIVFRNTPKLKAMPLGIKKIDLGLREAA